jgi:hypothetical protein
MKPKNNKSKKTSEFGGQDLSTVDGPIQALALL